MQKTIRPLLMAMLSPLALAAGPVHGYMMGDSYLRPDNVLTLDGGTQIANIDSGWLRNDFFHDPDNTNYAAGNCGHCALPRDNNHNNFFVFDVSGLRAPVSTLSFTVFTFSALETWHYYLHDYKGSVTALRNGTGGEASYKDLADGAVYGDAIISPADNHTFKTFVLSPQAVADLNEAVRTGKTQFVLGGTAIAVPEPGLAALLAAGLAVTAAWRRTASRGRRQA